MLDDPSSPPLTRASGLEPHPIPGQPFLPPSIVPRQVTLRDRVTIATLLPFSSPTQVPPSLLAYLSDQLNREIEKGDTYPMLEPLEPARFGPYWFGVFGAVMVLGVLESVEQLQDLAARGEVDWARVCLGSFYVKPNYPGRSSHVCNGGFLVTDAARNKGVGRLMGEGYLEWAPRLGYTYSVFNLVYETNVASCRIWDALGFKRIGRVPRCGALRSHPDNLIDALIYGRDLGPDGEDFVSEERFDKIRYYLQHGKYPAGADRAEKSRLRSAATHYKLLPPIDGEGGEERLMLKDKEVVADAQRQYEIARGVHAQGHGGINKTTATIAERYHWVRIKETVSLVIRNCGDCKEGGKVPAIRSEASTGGRLGSRGEVDPNSRIERLITFEEAQRSHIQSGLNLRRDGRGDGEGEDMGLTGDGMAQGGAPVAKMDGYDGIPLDPQMMAEGPGMRYVGGPERDAEGEDYVMEMETDHAPHVGGESQGMVRPGHGMDEEGVNSRGMVHHLAESAFGSGAGAS